MQWAGGEQVRKREKENAGNLTKTNNSSTL